MEYIKIKDILSFQKKSKIKASEGLKIGKYNFYTSSKEQNKFLDYYEYSNEALIIGTGGNANLHHSYGKFSVSTDCFVLESKDKNFLVEFIYRYLLKNINILENGFRGAGLKHISKEYLENIKIPIISLEKQKMIIKILKNIDIFIDKNKQIKNELSFLNKSLFRSLFLYSIQDYKEKKLEDIVEVKSSKRVFLNELSKNGIPFYRGTEIAKLSRGENVESNLFISEDLYQNLKKISDVPKIGDLLLPSICNNGEIWYVNKTNPFYFKDGRVLWLKLNKNINGKYLQYYLIEKFRQDYSKIASGTTFSELKIVTLKNLLLPVPPIELQNKFAERIEKIEKLSFEIEEAIKEAENLYNSLISKYFD